VAGNAQITVKRRAVNLSTALKMSLYKKIAKIPQQFSQTFKAFWILGNVNQSIHLYERCLYIILVRMSTLIFHWEITEQEYVNHTLKIDLKE
jgi:hypothetical protein